jgi:hypothetical protein
VAANLSAWLDGFLEGLVVYVSFGSQALLTPQVAVALAEVLDRSDMPFVWVVGTGNGGMVPNGFEARRGGKAQDGGARVGAAGVRATAHGSGVVRDALRLELSARGSRGRGAHAGMANVHRPIRERATARG